MKKVCIVEFPSNLGLKEPSPGKEPGVKKLPEWLQQYGFHTAVNPESIFKLPAPHYTTAKDSETKILNTPALITYAKEQAVVVNEILNKNLFPLVLGGDCSILLGAAVALKQKGNYGIFYLDGHTDFMDVSLSETGGMGGMAASAVTGNGHPALTNILNLKPYINEDNLWCVGNREYDDVYEDEIRNSAATYVPLHELRKKGIVNTVNTFLDEVKNKALDGFWLHIDLDVLDDAVMPCVDSRTPDGLSYEEFDTLLSILLNSSLLTGLEITILDPDLDPSGTYTKTFIEHFTTVINSAMKQ